MKRLSSILIAITALCCGSGCQCCALTEPYQDLVDCVSDHEGQADRFYHPGFDLTRIGRADWPWRWCRRGPRIPVVVYETPATDWGFSRERAQEEAVDPLQPPLVPGVAPDEVPDPEWGSQPASPATEGPMLETSPEPPRLTPPPPPAPMPAVDPLEGTTRRVVPPKDAPELMNRIGGDLRKQLVNEWPSSAAGATTIRRVDFDAPATASPDAAA
ncbi:MAG: hypothetical protein ACF8TS_13235, partial [Maioricimonas sp. JB049]